MKKTQTLAGMIFFISIIWPMLVRGQRNNWDTDYDAFQHDNFGIKFQSGDTNTPLLTMDWLLIHPGQINESCQITRSGSVFHRNGATQLDQTNLELLIETINALPPPPKIAPPLERNLVVRGIRSNHWFRCVYDRAKIPTEVEKLFEITGAYLEWYIPPVKGRNIVHSEYGSYNNLQAQINSFSLGVLASIAVSSGPNGVQIWNLKQGTVQDVLSDRILPIYREVDIASAISSDGNIFCNGLEPSCLWPGLEEKGNSNGPEKR